MNILYLTHGKPNFEQQHQVKDSIMNLGHKVVYYNYNSFIDSPDNQKLQDDILRIVEYCNIDTVFAIILKEEIRYETFDILRKRGVKVACWFSDDHWRYHWDRPLGTRFWLPHIDYAITTAGVALQWYKKDKFYNVIYSQWAANPDYFMPINLPKTIDVVFTGQNVGTRKIMTEELKKRIGNKYKFVTLGNEFDSGRISFNDYLYAINSAKINIHFANPPQGILKPIKAKNFEVPMCKAFLLAEYLPELKNYFNDNEMAYWDGMDDFAEKIDYYLTKGEDERYDIALNSYNRATREHTWEHRMKDIFNRIGD